MSLDQQLRRAAEATRGSVGVVDADASLHAFHVVRRRRQRARLLTAGMSGAAVVLLVGLGLWQPSQPSPPAPPPVAEVPSSGKDDGVDPDDTAPARSEGCSDSEAVRCLDASTVVVDGPVRYSVTAPRRAWSPLAVENAPEMTEVYQRHREAGVAFFIDPRATDRGEALRSAAEWARWVASRPFLRPTVAEPTRVDGLRAWRVDAVVDKSAQWPPADSCNSLQADCRALFSHYEGGTHETGPWRTMLSRYTFVDVPGRSTLVIWSWAFRYDTRAMANNAELVRAIDILAVD